MSFYDGLEIWISCNLLFLAFLIWRRILEPRLYVYLDKLQLRVDMPFGELKLEGRGREGISVPSSDLIPSGTFTSLSVPDYRPVLSGLDKSPC